MGKVRELWHGTKKYIFMIAVSILFYELLENFGIVVSGWRRLVGVLTPIILGLFIAYIVNIPALLLQNTIFKKQSEAGKGYVRAICLILSYAFVIGIVFLLFWLVIPKVFDSVKLLIENFEGYYRVAVDWATAFWEGLDLSEETTKRAVELSNLLLGKLDSFVSGLVPQLLNYTIDVVGIVADVLLALAFSVYVSIDKNKLLAHARRFLRAVFKEKQSEKLLSTFTFANRTYRSYIAGQITSCTIIGILCYIGMRLLNMPFPEMISVFIAVFALIPILGPWISTIPSAFIILMASPQNPALALWFIVMILVIQQIDNNFIYPHVVGDAVGLSSAWVLAAVILGSGLFGLVGLLFAVPTTAVLYRLIGDWVNNRAKRKGVPIVDTVPQKDYDLRGRSKPFGGKKNRGRDKKRDQADADAEQSDANADEEQNGTKNNSENDRI